MAEAGDFIREHRLVLRRATARPKKWILILASPLENSILERKRRDAFLPRGIQALRNVEGKIADAEHEIGPLPDQPGGIPLLIVNELRLAAESFPHGFDMGKLIAQQTPNLQT